MKALKRTYLFLDGWPVFTAGAILFGVLAPWYLCLLAGVALLGVGFYQAKGTGNE